MAKKLLALFPVTCFVLAAWQVKRLKWKEGLIRDSEESFEYDPVVVLTSNDILQNPARRYFIEGLSIGSPIFIGPRAMGSEWGYYLIRAVQLKDRTRILLNHGWVPTEMLETLDFSKDRRVKEIALKDFYEKDSFFLNGNDPSKGVWRLKIPSQLSAELNTEPILCKIVAVDQNINYFPRPSDGKETFRNNHKEYAVTWLLTGILTTALLRIL